MQTEWVAVAVVGMVLIWLAFVAGRKIGELAERGRHAADVPRIRQESVKRSRAVLVGQFSEQLAPYLPGFPYSPTEARFIGKPIDFLVFEGMDDKEIQSVVFVEVKSGASKLSPHQKSLKEAILAKRVEWYEYRVPTMEDVAE